MDLTWNTQYLLVCLAAVRENNGAKYHPVLNHRASYQLSLYKFATTTEYVFLYF